MTRWYLCYLQWLQLSVLMAVVYLCKWHVTVHGCIKYNMHGSNIVVNFTCKYLHWSATQCGTLTIWYFSSDHHSDVVVSNTLEASLNELSLWCTVSCVVCYYRSSATSSNVHPHRCYTLRWCCCSPGHSNSRGWAIHTLSTHSNSGGEWKLSSCTKKKWNVGFAVAVRN